jgi:hypothetical protein
MRLQLAHDEQRFGIDRVERRGGDGVAVDAGEMRLHAQSHRLHARGVLQHAGDMRLEPGIHRSEQRRDQPQLAAETLDRQAAAVAGRDPDIGEAGARHAALREQSRRGAQHAAAGFLAARRLRAARRPRDSFVGREAHAAVS